MALSETAVRQMSNAEFLKYVASVTSDRVIRERLEQLARQLGR